MEKGFVVYQVGHYGFLINAIIHKLTHHKDEVAFFLLDQVIMNNLAIEFVKNNSSRFDSIGKVILYSDKDIINQIQTQSADEIKLENIIDKYFTELLNNNSIDLSKATEVYSIFDTYNAFGVYLSIKGIYFNMLEGIVGQCQNEKRYFLNSQNKIYDEVIYKYRALSYNCPMVKKLYCAFDSAIKDKEYCEHQSDVDLIKDLDQNSINEIINIYGIDFSLFPKNSNMLVLSSGWIIGDLKIKLENYFYLYQKLIDYYIKDEPVFLKPHPNTDFKLDVWNAFFAKSKVVPGYFPSLLIPYVEELNINCIYSTSFSAVDYSDNRTKTVPFRYFYNNALFNKLFCAYSLGKYLEINDNSYEHYGMHNDVTWSFQQLAMGINGKSSWSSLEFLPGSFTVIDDINWNKGNYYQRCIDNMCSNNNDAIIVFLNSKSDFIFMDKNLLLVPYIIPIRIKKTKKKDNTMEPMNDETIYIFCKDEEKCKKIRAFSMEKDLSNVGVTLRVNQVQNQEIDIINMKLDYLISRS